MTTAAGSVRWFHYALLGLLVYLRTPIVDSATGRPEDHGVPSRTLAADIVFEGRAHREPRLPNASGLYTVRFKVLQLYKGRLPGPVGREGDTGVVSVGIFGRTNDTGNCRQVAPRVAMESRYIVFLVAKTDGVASGNGTSSSVAMATDERGVRTDESFYRISGCPEPASKKVSRLVRKHACPTCARVEKISPRQEIFAGQKALIHCRSSGKPRPNITWFKDGVKIRPTKHISLTQHRQSSQLKISRTRPSDSGLYQCQASNGLGRAHKVGTDLVVKQESNKPHSEPCPRQDYCLNGGTCYVVPLLNKNFCECSRHYTGLRCEEKFTNQNIQLAVGKEGKRKRASQKRRRF